MFKTTRTTRSNNRIVVVQICREKKERINKDRNQGARDESEEGM